jgi:hypothetical protein
MPAVTTTMSASITDPSARTTPVTAPADRIAVGR